MTAIGIAIIGGLLGMFGYGISDFAAKKTIDHIGDIKTLFYVQLIGTVMMLPYFFFDRQLPEFSTQNTIFILLFGLFNFIGYFALYNSFKVGKVSIVSPIASSYSILVAVVSFLFFGEIFGTMKVIVLALVLVGLLSTAVDFKQLKNGFQSSDAPRGVPQALLVFLIFGFYLPLWDKFLERGGWVIWLMLVRLIVSGIIFVYYSFIKRQSLLFKGRVLFYWIVLIAFFEALASFGSTWALDASSNTTSITVALTSAFSIVTAIMAFIFLKERLALNQYIGIVLIVIGLFLMPLI